MTDGGALDRLLSAQPVLYSVASSAAEYQRQLFGVQAQQHVYVHNTGYSATAHGKYAKRTLHSCAPLCFFAGGFYRLCGAGVRPCNGL